MINRLLIIQPWFEASNNIALNHQPVTIQLGYCSRRGELSSLGMIIKEPSGLLYLARKSQQQFIARLTSQKELLGL